MSDAAVTVIPAPVYSSEDLGIIDALRLAESIQKLDERSSMKIALALAGLDPQMFRRLLEVTKTQNLVPTSTLTGKLNPPPAVVTDKKEHQDTLNEIVTAVKGE